MDDYTPYGYLDNPWHSAHLNPSGVVRCQPAIGFARHYPGLAGHYTRHEICRAGLRLAIVTRGAVLLSAGDFAAAGVDVVSRYHSKNIMSCDCRLDGLQYSAAFFLNGEQALCCLMSIENVGLSASTAAWAMVAEYERQIGASEAWDAGVTGRWSAQGGAAALLSFPEGEAFVCTVDDDPDGIGIFSTEAEVVAWLRGISGNHPGQTGLGGSLATCSTSSWGDGPACVPG